MLCSELNKMFRAVLTLPSVSHQLTALVGQMGHLFLMLMLSQHFFCFLYIKSYTFIISKPSFSSLNFTFKVCLSLTDELLSFYYTYTNATSFVNSSNAIFNSPVSLCSAPLHVCVEGLSPASTPTPSDYVSFMFVPPV